MANTASSLERLDGALDRLRATLDFTRLQLEKPGRDDVSNCTSASNSSFSERNAARLEAQRSADVTQKLLLHRTQLSDSIAETPYDFSLYATLASVYLELRYPDLAIGSAYKALMLLDACGDEADEYHEMAIDALTNLVNVFDADERLQVQDTLSVRGPDADGKTGLHRWLSGFKVQATEREPSFWLELYGVLVYSTLIHALLECGCSKTASTYADQALLRHGQSEILADLKQKTQLSSLCANTLDGHGGQHSSDVRPYVLSDSGFVRRERYPWNSHEPDRLEELSTLNEMMSVVAPKLEVRVVELPTLAGKRDDVPTNLQLGVFAKEDLAPGEAVLDETSMLTANNKLQDALCDACSADLPALNNKAAENLAYCPECEVVFCSQDCFDRASGSYHPALCSKDVEAIAKDAPMAESADSLYALLLLRSLAMAETQECHPLDLDETRYIWGDFASTEAGNGNYEPPKALPFSFKYNVQMPFHMMEKMDMNIFTCPYAEVWVFNTLYAKFRGTASARLSGLGGRAERGPEVSAVHPMWCLANHSCDPNLSWEWGGSIKFWVREKRVEWNGKDGAGTKRSSGIRKGEEVLNHYCDIDLSVDQRREWARGALGGDCMCARCVWEAQHEEALQVEL